MPWIALGLCSIITVIITPLSLIGEYNDSDWSENKVSNMLVYTTTKQRCFENLTNIFKGAKNSIDIALSSPRYNETYTTFMNMLGNVDKNIRIRAYSDMDKSVFPKRTEFTAFKHDNLTFRAKFMIIDKSKIYFFDGISRKYENPYVQETDMCYVLSVENHPKLARDLSAVFEFLLLNDEKFDNLVVPHKYLTQFTQDSKYKIVVQPSKLFPTGRFNFSGIFNQIISKSIEKAVVSGSILKDTYRSYREARNYAQIMAFFEEKTLNEHFRRLVITQEHFEKYRYYFDAISKNFKRDHYFNCPMNITWTSVLDVGDYLFFPIRLSEMYDPSIVSVGIFGNSNFLQTYYSLTYEMDNYCFKFPM